MPNLIEQHPWVIEFLTTDIPVEELAKRHELKYSNYRDRVWRYRKDFYFIPKNKDDVNLLINETPNQMMLERWVRGSRNIITKTIVDCLFEKDTIEELYTIKWYSYDEIRDYYDNNPYLTDKAIQEYLSRNSIKRDESIDNVYRSKFYENRNKKSRATSQKKYGTNHPNQNKANYQKIVRTNLERYGVVSPLELDEVKEKGIQTSLRKYGTKHPSQSKVVMEKVDNTNFKRYGARRKNMTHNYRASYIDFTPTDYVKTPEEVIKLITPNERGEVPAHTLLREVMKSWGKDFLGSGDISKILGLNPRSVSEGKFVGLLDFSGFKKKDHMMQKEVFEYIKSIYNGEIVKEDRSILDGKEIDYYIPEHKIGIEFNGDYWHSDINKPKAYHEDKKKLATSKGVSLYAIWEHDWVNPVKRNIIESQIRYKLKLITNTIFARNTVVKPISAKISREFLTYNHIQGSTSAKYKYGLFSSDNLVAVMTFSGTRFKDNTKDSVELIRFANKVNTVVTGGFSKLLKYAINDIKMKRIVSYANLDITESSSIYGSQGFTFVKSTGPGYKWVEHTRSLYTISRQAVQPWKLLKYTNDEEGAVPPFPNATKDFRVVNKSETEREYMTRNNYFRVWDSGNDLFEMYTKYNK